MSKETDGRAAVEAWWLEDLLAGEVIAAGVAPDFYAKATYAGLIARIDAALAARETETDKTTTANVFRALKVTIMALAKESGVEVADDTLYPCNLLGNLVRALSAREAATRREATMAERAVCAKAVCTGCRDGWPLDADCLRDGDRMHLLPPELIAPHEYGTGTHVPCDAWAIYDTDARAALLTDQPTAPPRGEGDE